MKNRERFLRPHSAVAVLAVTIGLSFGSSDSHAGTVFGVDVDDYLIIYQGGSAGAQLSINNFGTTGIWTGNIGIAGVGKLAATGPGTVNGDINFAAPNTGQASISNTTVTGTVNYGVTDVQTKMDALNGVSTVLGAEAGTALSINTSSDQTVLASGGTLDGFGNRVFTVGSVNTGNGENFILKGNGSQNVVFNVNTPGDAQFHGNVLLQDLSGKFFGDAGYAGLSPDQVLFNLYAGDKLDANNNGNSAHPANIIYGTFLDPNGAISFVNTRITGRIFGGDSTNMQIVSGDTIKLPTCCSVPEPPMPALALVAGLLLASFSVRRRRGSALV